MKKAYIENIFAQKVKYDTRRDADIDATYAGMQKAAEIYLGDISDIPFRHIETVRNLELKPFVPSDFSFLSKIRLPASAMLFTWHDRNINARGYSENNCWVLVDRVDAAGSEVNASNGKPDGNASGKPEGKTGGEYRLHLGIEVRHKLVGSIVTNADISRIVFKNDGIYMDVKPAFLEKIEANNQTALVALQLFYYLLLSSINILSHLADVTGLTYSLEHDCYLFPGTDERVFSTSSTDKPRVVSKARRRREIRVDGAL